MKPEPSVWMGCDRRGFRRGLFSSGGAWKNKSSKAEPSLPSFFLEISIMTTLGATISKTLAKALLSWGTTSLPASAAAAGTVGVASGWAAGGAAKIAMVLSTQIRIEIGNERIIWSLDSIQRAMFIP